VPLRLGKLGLKNRHGLTPRALPERGLGWYQVYERAPAVGIPVSSWSALNTAVAANPAGSIFTLTNDMTATGQLPLKAGNQYWGTPGSPPTITGPGYNAGTPFAVGSVNNITLAHLHAQQFDRHAVSERGAMIGSEGYGGTGWTLQNVELSHTRNTIIDVWHGWEMYDCTFHHGGRHWATGGGYSGVNNKKIWRRIVAHDIANGTGGIPVFPNHDGNIGCKFAFSDYHDMDDIYVHDTGGNALWFDLANENITVRNVLIERAARSGLFFEVSYGPFLAENVTVRNSAWIQSGFFPYPAFAGVHFALTPDITATNINVDSTNNLGGGGTGLNGIIILHWNHPALQFGIIDSTRLGNENVIVNGGVVTGESNQAIGLNGSCGGTLSGDDGPTRPSNNIQFNSMTLDPGASTLVTNCA
jgi:hypothetical protein